MSAHRLAELGFVLGAIGAAIIAYGAAMIAFANRSYGGASDAQHRREKSLYAVGAAIIALAFFIEFIATVTR